MPPHPPASRGFTLIELMIVVAIAGILAAIVLPNYQEHVRRSHRVEAQRALLEAAQYMQRYYAANMAYDRALGATSKANDQDTTVLPAGLQTVLANGAPLYNVTIVTTPTHFNLRAVPVAGSLMDGDRCGSLTLSDTGIKGIGNDAATGITWENCWK